MGPPVGALLLRARGGAEGGVRMPPLQSRWQGWRLVALLALACERWTPARAEVESADGGFSGDLATELFQAQNAQGGASAGHLVATGSGSSASLSGGAGGGAWEPRPLALLLPDESHTKLELQAEALEMLERVEGPVALVAVIGPYRSGKSFLLNQLLGQPCNRGFGVGHQRHTQTKGMWLWGTPVPLSRGPGQAHERGTASLLFVDTEGFESVGRSDVYDDRIFALAAVMSSLLIYNLPETVREADIEKLSFAVDLADEFFGRAQQRGAGDLSAETVGGGGGYTLEPANLLWLIQRDFLQGQTVQEMVDQALEVVPNPRNDPEVERVNQVRSSLGLMARNSSAFSLVQPHQERTKLCELGDGQLDARYVVQRDRLRALVHSLAVPKARHTGGVAMTGVELAASIRKTVGALNEGDIPRAGSVVRAFNRELSMDCAGHHLATLEREPLPVEEEELVLLHDKGTKAAVQCFQSKRFGRSKHGIEKDEVLQDMYKSMEASFAHRKEANLYSSSKLCDEVQEACVQRLADLQDMRLPSMRRFQASVSACNVTFAVQCIGPSKPRLLNKHTATMSKELSLFKKDYNDKLFNGIAVVSVGMVSFAALELYPKLSFAGNKGLYDSEAWHYVTRGWELLVFNDVYHLEEALTPLVIWCILGGILTMQLVRFYKGLQRLRHSMVMRVVQWLCPCINCFSIFSFCWRPAKRSKSRTAEGLYDKPDPDV